MATTTKIFELKTLGYDKLLKELEIIEKKFLKLKITKQELNLIKLTTPEKEVLILKENAKALERVTIQLEKLKLRKLELEKSINSALVFQQKEIDLTKTEIGSKNDLILKLKQLNTLRNNLSPTGTGTISFNGQQLNFEQAKAQAVELTRQIKVLGNTTGELGTIGAQVTTGLTNGFQKLSGQLGQFILNYVGIFAGFRVATELLKENVEISDSFANLQIRMHTTKEEVDNLVDSLRKIDTRTSLQGLVELAEIISKKGVKKEDLADLTREFDRLNVVLGTEIGEPNTATANIIKIITIFNDDKRVTAERVREVGTSLFKLTTTGVATGEFLVNFAERVGAVRGITGLTATEIFGMGAALQQLGQRVELSGTAIIQLTTKMFSNVEKWADAANLTTEAFRDILNKSPAEALILIGENLKNLPADEIAAKFEEIVIAFNEVGITGARIKAVFGDIATNADFVRDRISRAKVTLKDYADQTAAAELKQNTFAATLQRIRKEFELVGTSKALQVALTAVAALLLLLVSNIGLVVTALVVYATAWSIANYQLIYNRLNIIAWTIAVNLQTAAMNIASIATRAWAISLALADKGLKAIGISTSVARTATLLLVGVIAAAVGVGILIGEIFLKAANSLGYYTDKQRIVNEVTKEANESISSQVNELNILVGAIKSSVTSLDTKKIILEKLIEKNALFSKALKDNVIDLTELDNILGTVTSSLEKFSRAQVSENLSNEKLKDLLKIESVKQKIETETAIQGGGTITLKNLDSEELNILKSIVNGRNSLRVAYKEAVFLSTDINSILKDLGIKENEKKQIYEAYKNTAQTYLKDYEEDKKKEIVNTDKIRALTLKEKISNAELNKLNAEELEYLIKSITTERDKLKEGDSLLNDYNNKLERFQARLNLIRNKKTTPGRPYRGARLGGEEKDALEEIEILRKRELLAQDTYFASIQANRLLTFEEQLRWLEDTKDTNQKYLDLKIAYLNSQKNLNVKERDILAGFNKSKIDLEIQYQEDIQGVKDKEFRFRLDPLKEKLQQDIADLKLALDVIENNPNLSFTIKAQARLDTDTAILKLQKEFNNKVDDLEKELNQRSKANSKEGAKDILRTLQDLIKDQNELRDADVKDIILTGDKIKLQWDIVYEKIRQGILNNDKITAKKRARQLEQLEKEENYSIALAEYKTNALVFKKIKEQWDQHLIDEKTYLEAKKKLEESFTKVQNAKKGTLTANSYNDPSTANSLDIASSKLSELFGFNEGSEEDKILAYTISYAWETAQLAMTEYFNAERQAIEDNLNLVKERLDLEKQQRIARATSQAEIDSIEKQYAAKKRKAEQDAGEQLKKSKKAEARIAFLTEVANIWASAFQLGPVAGPIFGSILSALALTRYAITVASINREKFEYGGSVVPLRGGKFGGKSHEEGGTPFRFKGSEYEAQVDELAIIRTKNVDRNKIHTITGNHEQIASMLNRLGGGVHFKPGARVFAEGGLLGSNYSAPIFRPTSISSSIDMESLRNEIIFLAKEQSKRIDRFEVIQVTSSVSNALRKEVKQKNIGSL